MAINYNELEEALYHIRVCHLGLCIDGYQIQLSPRGDGDVEIDVWDEKLNRIGNFFLSELTEELAMMRKGKIGLGDLFANRLE